MWFDNGGLQREHVQQEIKMLNGRKESFTEYFLFDKKAFVCKGKICYIIF